MLYANSGINTPYLAQAFNPFQAAGDIAGTTGAPWTSNPLHHQAMAPNVPIAAGSATAQWPQQQLQQPAPQQLQALQQYAQQQYLIAQQLAQQAAAQQAAAQQAYQQAVQAQLQLVAVLQNQQHQQLGHALGTFTPGQAAQGQFGQVGQGQHTAMAGQPFGTAANWMQPANYAQPAQQQALQQVGQQLALQQLLLQQQQQAATQQAAAQGLLGNSFGGQFAPLPGQLGGQLGMQHYAGGFSTLH